MTSESNLSNWSIIWFQASSKQSVENQQISTTVAVILAQYHLWFYRCYRNKFSCRLVAYQEDGHRLRECTLQRSKSRKLTANLQDIDHWEIPTLEYIAHFSREIGKPSNLATHLPCEISMNVPRPETTQHPDTHHWSSALSKPHRTVQFSEATWSSTTGCITTLQGKHWSKTARHTGPLQTSTDPQIMWIVHGSL
jgi:hypothetical protein